MEFKGHEEEEDDAGSPPTTAATVAYVPATRRYHECLRNHAAATGGHVVDGCCEFMSASLEDALTCAACACHRSFHRRDPSPGRPLPLLAAANMRAPAPLLLTSKHPRQRFPYLTPSGGTTTDSSSEERRGPRKRSRTTFTREQKEEMLAFAERVGWRIQRQDEAAVERFCAQVGVRRQALKVWMHNNKQTSAGRRRQQQQNKLQEHG